MHDIGISMTMTEAHTFQETNSSHVNSLSGLSADVLFDAEVQQLQVLGLSAVHC